MTSSNSSNPPEMENTAHSSRIFLLPIKKRYTQLYLKAVETKTVENLPSIDHSRIEISPTTPTSRISPLLSPHPPELENVEHVSSIIRSPTKNIQTNYELPVADTKIVEKDLQTIETKASDENVVNLPPVSSCVVSTAALLKNVQVSKILSVNSNFLKSGQSDCEVASIRKSARLAEKSSETIEKGGRQSERVKAAKLRVQRRLPQPSVEEFLKSDDKTYLETGLEKIAVEQRKNPTELQTLVFSDQPCTSKAAQRMDAVFALGKSEKEDDACDTIAEKTVEHDTTTNLVDEMISKPENEILFGNTTTSLIETPETSNDACSVSANMSPNIDELPDILNAEQLVIVRNRKRKHVVRSSFSEYDSTSSDSSSESVLPKLQELVCFLGNVGDEDCLPANKSLRPWLSSKEEITDFKSIKSCTIMLNLLCLSNKFKCMSSDCVFSTQNLNEFECHITLHDDSPGSLQCANCFYIAEDSVDLTRHLEEIHSMDFYQCYYCFYRSCNMDHLNVHHKKYHNDLAYNHINVEDPIALKMEPQLCCREAKKAREMFVFSFGCDDCETCFYLLVPFIQHLINKHSHNFRCNICHKKVLVDHMINHLKVKHHFGLYQCISCFFGCDTVREMKIHLADHHPSKAGALCKREICGNTFDNNDYDEDEDQDDILLYDARSIESTRIYFIGPRLPSQKMIRIKELSEEEDSE